MSDRIFLQAQYVYGARNPRVIDLCSFEETSDESVIIVPYYPPEVRKEFNEKGIAEQRFTVHYGTKSKEFSQINFHRKIQGEPEICYASLTSAVKKGGWAMVMKTLQAYREFERGDQSDSPGPRVLVSHAPIERGQIGYQIAVSRREEVLEVSQELSEFAPYCAHLDIGRFRFLVFLHQTMLPVTTQGFTQGHQTLRPEELDVEDEKLMRSIMSGMDGDQVIREFLLGDAGLTYLLCDKLEKHPEQKRVLWKTYASVKTLFDEAKKLSRENLIAGDRLYVVDGEVPHPITAIDSSMMQVKYR